MVSDEVMPNNEFKVTLQMNEPSHNHLSEFRRSTNMYDNMFGTELRPGKDGVYTMFDTEGNMDVDTFVLDALKNKKSKTFEIPPNMWYKFEQLSHLPQ